MSDVPTWDSTEPIAPQASPSVVPEALAPNVPTWEGTTDLEQFETPGQQAKAFVEGAAQGLAGPLAPLIEKKVFGVKEENIRGRQAVHPGTHTLGEVTGLGAGLLTGTGEAALMTKAGEAATSAVGLADVAKTATFLQKVGSEAVKQAAEMAVFQAGDEASKMVLHDPQASAESAIANVGLATALGGGIGAGFGATGAMWNATLGPKVEGFLGALKSRLNGESSSALVKEAQELGIELKPELAGAMSDDPMLKNAASGLRQTDTSFIARGFQKNEGELRSTIADRMVETLGKTPGEVESLELSKATHGKNVGDALVKEYKSRIDPIIKDLEEAKNKFADTELPKSETTKVPDLSNPYAPTTKEVVTPGVTHSLSDRIMTKAAEEGWMADTLSPEARMIKAAVKELKTTNTLGELIKFGQNIGQKTKSTLPFGMETPLSRAGSIVRGIVRDSENDVILARLGKSSPGALEKYRGALSEFKEVAALRDELNDRLKVGGSVSGFAKGLANMAKTDSETLLNRLKGTDDAHVLSFLSEHFPETAQKLRQFHIDALLEKAAQPSANGEKPILSAAKLMTGIDKMSPELRQFTLGPQTTERLGRLNGFLERLNDHRHNFSNTARTVDKVLSGSAGGAMGLIAAISGHGGLGIMVPVAGMLGKEGTAGVRLAMLKYLSSPKNIEAGGFKAAASFLNTAYKGEMVLNKSVQAVFKPGSMAVPGFKMPTELSRAKLDRLVTERQDNPDDHMQAMSNQAAIGHYLEDHHTSSTIASTRALQYLQQIKPKPFRSSPLDREIEPTPAQKARYDRALDIAQQPAIVLQHIKDGTLQSTDIQDLNSMYPAYYSRMVQKVSGAMMARVSDEAPIPYTTRMGISLLIGSPIDSSMQPMSIMAAQPKPKEQPQGQGGGKAPKSMNKLGKTNKMYQTPNQGAENDRANRD